MTGLSGAGLMGLTNGFNVHGMTPAGGLMAQGPSNLTSMAAQLDPATLQNAMQPLMEMMQPLLKALGLGGEGGFDMNNMMQKVQNMMGPMMS